MINLVVLNCRQFEAVTSPPSGPPSGPPPSGPPSASQETNIVALQKQLADAIARADAEQTRANSQQTRAEAEKTRADAHKSRADKEKARADASEREREEIRSDIVEKVVRCAFKA